jgi:pimeloyl-ACP methyl ester carboxylesterase
MQSLPVMRGVRTSFGVIPLCSEGLDTSRPVILAIRGAFAPFDQLSWLGAQLPEAEVVVAHLPGLIGPLPEAVSIQGFANAFRELIETIYAGRQVVVVGASIGGLVALSLNSDRVKGVVAIDPPLSTAKLWPLRDWAETARPALSVAHQEWLWRILGYGPKVEDRCYDSVIENLKRHAHVIVAGVALHPRRNLASMPGLLDAADIALLRSHPLLTVRVAREAGHDVATEHPSLLLNTIREALTPLQGTQ